MLKIFKNQAIDQSLSLTGPFVLNVIPRTAHNRQCSHRRRLRTQHARAQRDARPSLETLAFLISPTAFGAKQNRDRVTCAARFGQRAGKRRRAGIFIKNESKMSLRREHIFETSRIFNHRQMIAPRLLARFERDPSPALHAFARCQIEPALASHGLKRNNGIHAQLGRLFDHPFEMIELDQRRKQSDMRIRWSRRKFFDGSKHHLLLARGLDFGKVHTAVVGNLVTLARFDPKDAGQVLRVFACDLGVPVSNFLDKKSSPHSAILVQMIAHLRGTLLEKHPNAVIIDVHGVGYEVAIPVSAFSSLPEKGTEVALHIHTHVREDAISLFGFLSAADKTLFEKLIGVSGIGPKLAITTLSGLTGADLVNAIRSGAIEHLVRIPGVGKKTAERMVLELRDKLDLAGLPDRAMAAAAPKSTFNVTEEDVISALMNFGANRASAEAAVNKARSSSEPNDFDPLFRRALKLVR